ncbi:MAG: LysE family transporter [Tateyamaria sp.]|jgi:threonine/homoserine/homoserine lactone efflux protein|nr:LysE family transporter [Tateyamaria sp.]MDG1181244.1 LysE family transporter [Tateyamaria sp.]MDG1334940.1 LysE family transporter [Tateyamaria sp.]MDG2056908.1 LysE family transporter [Tateyamaria sp.]
MITFAAAVFFLIITPGPGVLSAAGVGAAYGMRSGLNYVTGLFIGNNLVILAVISGLAAVVLAVPWVRIVLFALSTAYLLYIALRIAFAGSSIRFITVQSKPGVLAGILLQPINPKAYAVNTALFSGFAMFPDALVAEALWKLVIVNAIWLPIHVLWVWFGTVLQKLELQPRQHRLINMAMASSMLFVVALAVASAF